METHRRKKGQSKCAPGGAKREGTNLPLNVPHDEMKTSASVEYRIIVLNWLPIAAGRWRRRRTRECSKHASPSPPTRQFETFTGQQGVGFDICTPTQDLPNNGGPVTDLPLVAEISWKRCDSMMSSLSHVSWSSTPATRRDVHLSDEQSPKLIEKIWSVSHSALRGRGRVSGKIMTNPGPSQLC